MQQAFSNLTPPSRHNNPSPRVVCLVGFMGSGKTTVGNLLARQLGWRFEDLDARVEQHTGLGIPAIFEQMGEPAFRRMEAEQLETILGQASESRGALVLALGGGTYAQPGAPERLRSAAALVVWLDCAVDLLLARCATMTNRPLFRDEPSFRSLLEARLPFYAQADHRVAGGDDPARIVESILALQPFERLTGAKDEYSLRQVNT